MSTQKLDQTRAVLVTTEAATKRQTAALTEQYLTALHRSIKAPSGNREKQKQLLRFCPVCQMLLRKVESRPTSLRCKKCGYKTQLEQATVLDAKQLHHNEIAVIDKEKENLYTYPIVQALCEKCGKKESETWAIAVGSEGSISAWVFLRCVHCGFTRREVG